MRSTRKRTSAFVWLRWVRRNTGGCFPWRSRSKKRGARRKRTARRRQTDWSVDLAFFRTLFSEDANLGVPRVANERDAEVCQVIDKLVARRKISAEGYFDVGERIPERNQAFSKHIDAHEIRVGQDFCPGGSFQLKGTGNSGLASGVAQVGLIFETGNREGSGHGLKQQFIGKLSTTTGCWFGERLGTAAGWPGIRRPETASR